MKKKIHPKYQKVLFVDSSTGFKFLCGTTLQPQEEEEFEGKKYPVYRVPVSSSSHPFFTREKEFVDTEGTIDKLKKRYAKKREEAIKAKEKPVEKPVLPKKKVVKKAVKKAVKKVVKKAKKS